MPVLLRGRQTPALWKRGAHQLRAAFLQLGCLGERQAEPPQAAREEPAVRQFRQARSRAELSPQPLSPGNAGTLRCALTKQGTERRARLPFPSHPDALLLCEKTPVRVRKLCCSLEQRPKAARGLKLKSSVMLAFYNM